MRKARTATLLLDLCRAYPAQARKVASTRPALQNALVADPRLVEQALREEEDATRATDRTYWKPLREELVQWRQKRSKGEA